MVAYADNCSLLLPLPSRQPVRCRWYEYVVGWKQMRNGGKNGKSALFKKRRKPLCPAAFQSVSGRLRFRGVSLPLQDNDKILGISMDSGISCDNRFTSVARNSSLCISAIRWMVRNLNPHGTLMPYKTRRRPCKKYVDFYGCQVLPPTCRGSAATCPAIGGIWRAPSVACMPDITGAQLVHVIADNFRFRRLLTLLTHRPEVHEDCTIQ